jgi:hypothetical protein
MEENQAIISADVPAVEAPYKVQVIADRSGKWCGNQLEFTRVDLAKKYAVDLWQRWTLVTDWRVINRNGNEVARMSK